MLIQKKLNRDAGKLRLRLKQAFSLLFACLMILQTGVVTAFAAPSASVIRSDELRGVWISYLDWERLPADHPLARAHWSDKVLWMQTRTQGGQVHHCIGASASSTPGNMYLDLVTIARDL